MRYVIIGNSAAAIGCVEGIRQQDTTGEITIISGEKYDTYSRPLISYWLQGKVDEEHMRYRNKDFYKENSVKRVLGKRVTAIDTKKSSIALNDGSSLEYNKLLIATGSRPIVPNIAGLDTVTDRFTFMCYDDAKAIEKCAAKNKRVLIMGAGLIGLKAAEALQDKVQSITVVDLADRILPSILNSTGAGIMQSHMEGKGIHFITGDGIQSFDTNSAVLSSGKTIPFDILIIAVGVRPNVELVTEAGGKVGKAIKTDKRQATSLANIYAAGDCTESYDIASEADKVLALLPNAYIQGEVAGSNMAGTEKTYEKAIPMNAIGFFGKHIISAGSYDGEVVEKNDTENYKVFYIKDGLLKGFIAIGDIQRAGIYTNIIREQMPLDSLQAELLFDRPQLLAYSKTARADMLGGAK